MSLYACQPFECQKPITLDRNSEQGNKLVPELTDINEHYDQGLFVCFPHQIIWTSRTGLNLFYHIFATQRVILYMFIPIIPESLQVCYYFLILQGHCTDIAGYCPEMASGLILLHC